MNVTSTPKTSLHSGRAYRFTESTEGAEDFACVVRIGRVFGCGKRAAYLVNRHPVCSGHREFARTTRQGRLAIPSRPQIERRAAIAIALEHYDAGLSHRAIARRMASAKATVTRWLSEGLEERAIRAREEHYRQVMAASLEARAPVAILTAQELDQFDRVFA